MKIDATSWPNVTLWPRQGLVSLTQSLIIQLVDGRSLYLPRGMRSDGASVPAPLWSVLDASPTILLLMGIGHDGAYRSDAVWDHGDATTSPITRHEADELARALALHSGCSRLDADKIRWGLAVGGAPCWHRHTLDWDPR